MRVLCSSGFSADDYAVELCTSGSGPRASVYSAFHTLNYGFEVLRRDAGYIFLCIEWCRSPVISYFFYHMRYIERSSVGNDGRHIGHLQRGGANLSLPY